MSPVEVKVTKVFLQSQNKKVNSILKAIAGVHGRRLE
jgi:hypothetical protein